MSSDEFTAWQAYLRRNPAGTPWENRMFAELKREISKLQPRPPGERVKNIDHFLWKPLEPIFVTRLRVEARERQKAQQAKES